VVRNPRVAIWFSGVAAVSGDATVADAAAVLEKAISAASNALKPAIHNGSDWLGPQVAELLDKLGT